MKDIWNIKGQVEGEKLKEITTHFPLPKTRVCPNTVENINMGNEDSREPCEENEKILITPGTFEKSSLTGEDLELFRLAPVILLSECQQMRYKNYFGYQTLCCFLQLRRPGFLRSFTTASRRI